MTQILRPVFVERQIMSRFPAVHRIAPSVILAGQVRFPVRLDASSLGSCPWWNDRENDQGFGSHGRLRVRLCVQRRVRKNAVRSLPNSSGSSWAAKWPPRGMAVYRVSL